MQPDQRALGVAEIPHDLAQRLRQPAHQSRNGQDLISFRQLRVLEQVNHLDPVSPGEVLLTEFFEVGKGRDRFRGLPRDVQPQRPDFAFVPRFHRLDSVDGLG